MRSSAKSKSTDPRSPGAFLSDGSFSEKAELRHRGHIHGLVRALVTQRRDGALYVAIAVAAIRAANADLAFPNIGQWESVNSWPLCQASTSAEEAVKRAGFGTDGHWCAGRWAAGPTVDCHENAHRAVRCPPACQVALDEAFAALGAGYAGTDSPPPMS